MAVVDMDLRRLLDEGWTLPATWYSDPEIAALERDRIFARNWHYAGHAEGLTEHGSYFTTRCGHVPVIVVRDGDEIRAFVNVCRHRGHIVAQGEGRKTSLQCPYHAWTYGLDGCLRGVPRMKREADFDRSELGLLPVAVETWGQLVFVNPDPEAGPLADALGMLPAIFEETGIDLDALRFRVRVPWKELHVNWKNALENYLECYHCPVAHPGFSKVIDVDPDAYELRAEGPIMSQFGPARGDAEKRAQFHLMWPNTTFNIELGPPNLALDSWTPAGTHGMFGVTDYFFAPDVTEEEAQAIIDFGQQVNAEDMDLVAGVQAGLDSGMVPQGRLMTQSEQLIAHFQHLVHDALV